MASYSYNSFNRKLKAKMGKSNWSIDGLPICNMLDNYRYPIFALRHSIIDCSNMCGCLIAPNAVGLMQ